MNLEIKEPSMPRGLCCHSVSVNHIESKRIYLASRKMNKPCSTEVA